MAHRQPEPERPGEPVDVFGVQAELLGQAVDGRLRGARVDLQPDHRQESPAPELLLEGEQEVVGGIVVEGQVGIPCDPEDAGLAHVHAREQLVEEGHHDLLEGHESLAAGQRKQSVDVRRDLHPGEPGRVVVAAADLDADVERQVGDVGEGMARVDGQRGDHRQDEAVEQVVEVVAVGLVEFVPVAEFDALGGQRRHQACRAGASPDAAPCARARPARRRGAARECCR